MLRLDNLSGTDMVEINRKLRGGVALFGMHLWHYGANKAKRRRNAERICQQPAQRRVGFNADRMAAEFETYHRAVPRALKLDIPVGFLFESWDDRLTEERAEARIRRRYERLQQVDRSGRTWIVVPTLRAEAQPLHQDWKQFVQCIYGIGVRQPVLFGCSMLLHADGTPVYPRARVYACLNELALVIEKANCFEDARMLPGATFVRRLPF